MSANLEHVREDIESILKEIYAKYHSFYDTTLYYKMKGEDMKYIRLRYYMTNFTYALSVIFDQDLDWELYVEFRSLDQYPSRYCLRLKPILSEAVFQFTTIPSVSNETRSLFKNPIIDDKDPLTQLLIYRRFLLKRFPQRSYFCFYAGLVKPDPLYPEDPTSIFHGREGIIAYCTTFANFVHLLYEEDLESLNSKFTRLYNDTMNKLDSNKQLKELHKKDPIKACDINLIESIIHDEIEKANELMRQYGIIRVAFPLE